MDQDQAKAALAAVSSARGRLADGMVAPLWRHLAFGALFGALNLLMSMPHTVFGPGIAALTVLIALLLRFDRKRYGVWINSYRFGRTLPVTIALLIAQVGLVVVARPARELPFPSILGLGCAATAFVVAVLGSMLFNRIYLAELRSKDQ